MLTRLYDWTMGLAAHRHAMAALAAISFIESSVFPIPPDVLLIAMVVANPAIAWRAALVCTAASVAGGLFGYGIGYFLYETVGRPIIDFYGYTAQFGDFRALYNEWGGWIVAAGGLTPIPYKVVTIASGVTQLDPVVFTIASAASRGLRFFLVAALLWRFGPPIRSLIERNLGLAATLLLVGLFGGFVALKLLL